MNGWDWAVQEEWERGRMGLGNKKLWEAWPKTSGKVSQQQLRVKGCVLESCEVPSGSIASEGQESAFETELSLRRIRARGTRSRNFWMPARVVGSGPFRQKTALVVLLDMAGNGARFPSPTVTGKGTRPEALRNLAAQLVLRAKRRYRLKPTSERVCFY